MYCNVSSIWILMNNFQMSVKSFNRVATVQTRNQTCFEVNCTFSDDITFIVKSHVRFLTSRHLAKLTFKTS